MHPITNVSTNLDFNAKGRTRVHFTYELKGYAIELYYNAERYVSPEWPTESLSFKMAELSFASEQEMIDALSSLAKDVVQREDGYKTIDEVLILRWDAPGKHTTLASLNPHA